jgi:hypothetical protein
VLVALPKGWLWWAWFSLGPVLLLYLILAGYYLASDRIRGVP